MHIYTQYSWKRARAPGPFSWILCINMHKCAWICISYAWICIHIVIFCIYLYVWVYILLKYAYMWLKIIVKCMKFQYLYLLRLYFPPTVPLSSGAGAVPAKFHEMPEHMENHKNHENQSKTWNRQKRSKLEILRIECAWCGNCSHTLWEYFAHIYAFPTAI